MAVTKNANGYYSDVTNTTYPDADQAHAAEYNQATGHADPTSVNGGAGVSVGQDNGKAAADALAAQKGPGYTAVQEPDGTWGVHLSDPASAQLGYLPGGTSPAPSSAASAPRIPGVGQPGGPGYPAAVTGVPTAPTTPRAGPAQAPIVQPVQRVVNPNTPRPPVAIQGAPAPAPPPTSVQSPTAPAYASVDWQPYNTALQSLTANQAQINSELDRLSGGDPFGNEAFLQQATNRAQATAMGTAASARGGPAALAGANRVATGVQTQLQAQGAEQMGQQRAQDEVQAAGIRATDLATSAGLSQNILNTTTDLTKATAQIGVDNVNSWLTKYGIDTTKDTDILKVAQDNVDNLRNAATAYAQVDQARYNTDMTYRASVDDDITKRYLGDEALKGTIAQIKAGQKLTGKDVLLGLLNAGAGVAAKVSDRNAKTDIRDPDLHDLAKFLETRAYRYKYKDAKHGSGEFFGPMAQDLLKSKAGRAAVITTPEGLKVDTGRLALADHAALTMLADTVKKLSAKRRGR